MPKENDEASAVEQPQAKHKVIADIHSGMVLLAPVSSEVASEDAAEDDEEGGRGPLN